MKKILITTQDKKSLRKNNFDIVSYSPIESFKNGEIRNRIYGIDPNELTNSQLYLFHKFSKETINSDILWLLLTTKLIKKYASKLTLILPFLPYTRKDRADKGQNYIDDQVILDIINLLSKQGVDQIVTADLHNNNIKHFSPCDIKEISFQDIFKKQFTQGGCIVSPDLGAAKKVISIAENHGLDSIIIHKIRNTNKQETHINQIYKTEKTKPKADCFYIIDDMMDTGGTLLKTIEFLKQKYDPSVINIYITHTLLSDNGQYNLEKMLHDHQINYLTTNSFNHSYTKLKNSIDIDDLLFQEIWKP